jgi:plastocyanin
MRCRLRMVALAAITLALPAAASLATRTFSVSQIGRAFASGDLHLRRGDIVRFINNDVFDHQVYVDAPNFKFASDEQVPGSSTEVRFTAAGTFEVRCQIHPRMHLNVIVE